MSISFLECLNCGFVKPIAMATFTKSDIDIGQIAIADMTAQGLVRNTKLRGGFGDSEKATHAASTRGFICSM